jgi:hypothetical protein
MLPLLGACAPQVEATIPVSAVFDAGARTISTETPLVLRIPQPSDENCSKDLDRLVTALRKFTPIAVPGRCTNDDGDTFAEVETVLAIMPANRTPSAARLFTLLVGPSASVRGSYLLTFRVTEKVDVVAKAIQGEDAGPFELDPAKITFHLKNDGAAEAALVPGEVFVNGKPQIGLPGTARLPPGGALDIALSDLGARYVADGNAYAFAALGTAAW